MQPDLFAAVPAHNPNGKVRLRPLADVQCGAVFGRPDCYRYRLWRSWAAGKTALVVMMNPSTADAHANDPTVFKVVKMARRWLHGAVGTLLVGNVFAYRTTDQATLGAVEDPVGPDNDAHLLDMARSADLVVFAYGKPKIARLRARGPAVARTMIEAGIEPHVLRLSRSGVPWHPLYLPDDIQPVRWQPPA